MSDPLRASGRSEWIFWLGVVVVGRYNSIVTRSFPMIDARTRCSSSTCWVTRVGSACWRGRVPPDGGALHSCMTGGCHEWRVGTRIHQPHTR